MNHFQRVLYFMKNFVTILLISSSVVCASQEPDRGADAIRAAARAAIRQQQDPTQRMEHYIQNSSIAGMYVGDKKVEMKNALRGALSNWIGRNKNQWPRQDQLQATEQFFLNMKVPYSEINEILSILFKQETKGSHDEFAAFCAPYFDNNGSNFHIIKKLLPIYQVFPDTTNRQNFMTFCESYFDGWLQKFNKVLVIENLFPIYQAFPRESEMQNFLSFLEPLFSADDYSLEGNSQMMRILFPIYQAFPEEMQMKAFKAFCQPYLGRLGKPIDISNTGIFVPIYKEMHGDHDRHNFMEFCMPYLTRAEYGYGYVISNSLCIYQAFQDDAERRKFIDFSSPYFHLENCDMPGKKNYNVNNLISIYKKLPTEEGKQSFMNFCNPFFDSNGSNVGVIIDLFPIYHALPREEEKQSFMSSCESYYARIFNKEGKIRVIRDLFSIFSALPTEEEKQSYIGTVALA